jgi:hypothetical protein
LAIKKKKISRQPHDFYGAPEWGRGLMIFEAPSKFESFMLYMLYPRFTAIVLKFYGSHER